MGSILPHVTKGACMSPAILPCVVFSGAYLPSHLVSQWVRYNIYHGSLMRIAKLPYWGIRIFRVHQPNRLYVPLFPSEIESEAHTIQGLMVLLGYLG